MTGKYYAVQIILNRKKIIVGKKGKRKDIAKVNYVTSSQIFEICLQLD